MYTPMSVKLTVVVVVVVVVFFLVVGITRDVVFDRVVATKEETVAAGAAYSAASEVGFGLPDWTAAS
jgi:hypothetical protein